MATFDQTWSVKKATETAEEADQRGTYQWDSLKDQNAKNVKTAADVSARAIDTSKSWDDFAKNELQRYSLWQPAEKFQLDTAMGWNSPDRKSRVRGMAVADQMQAGELAKQKSLRTLGDWGINPNSGANKSLDRTANIMTGSAGASAGTMADVNTELQQMELLQGAINTGAAIPQRAAGAAGVGMQAASLGVNAPIAATTAQASTMGTPTQWAGLKQQGYKNATDIMLQSAALQQRDAELAANQSSGIGALVGAGAGLLMPLIGGAMGGPAGAMMGGMMASGMSKGASAGGGLFTRSARGGMVRNFADGGPVDDMDMDEGMGGYNDMDGDEGMYVDPSMSPSGGAMTDDVDAQIDGDPEQPAKINAGEFIMPKDVVAWRGEAWMQKEIKKAREEMAQAQNRPAQPELVSRPPVAAGQPHRYQMGAPA